MRKQFPSADANACPVCGAPIRTDASSCHGCGETLTGRDVDQETTVKLTQLQRTTLTAYLNYAESPPTWGKLFRLAWRRHLILLGIATAAVVYFVAMGALQVAIGFAAFVAGALLGDIGMFRRFLHFWPVLVRVLNRDRIRELLTHEDEGRPTPE